MDQFDGIVCFGAGVILTTTVVGSIIGIPLMVVGAGILATTADSELPSGH